MGSHEVLPFAWLAERWSKLPRRFDSLLVGLDGRGGSGKTTFATALAAALPTVQVVAIDDFYIPHELRGDVVAAEETTTDDTDVERLRRDVLLPLSSGQPPRYRRWDWAESRLGDWRELALGGVVLIEGAGVLSLELRREWDDHLWMSCPRELRIERGLARDGDAQRELWEQRWLPAGDRYERMHRPSEAAAVVFDSSGRVPHDRLSEFVRLL